MFSGEIWGALFAVPRASPRSFFAACRARSSSCSGSSGSSWSGSCRRPRVGTRWERERRGVEARASECFCVFVFCVLLFVCKKERKKHTYIYIYVHVLGPIWPFFWSYAFDRKKWPYMFFTFFFQQHVEKIWASYAEKSWPYGQTRPNTGV